MYSKSISCAGAERLYTVQVPLYRWHVDYYYCYCTAVGSCDRDAPAHQTPAMGTLSSYHRRAGRNRVGSVQAKRRAGAEYMCHIWLITAKLSTYFPAPLRWNFT